MSDPAGAQEFAFDPFPPADGGGTEVHGLARVASQQELERIRRAVDAVGEAAYHWVIESDELFWGGETDIILGCAPAGIASGKAFAGHLDIDNFTGRYDTVMRSAEADEGEGVPYQIEYLFRPDGRNGRRAVWIEDCGRWFKGKDSRPAEAYGTVRRIDDRHRRDQHLSFLGNCDPLTGMMNRGRMADALGEAIAVAAREAGSCAFVIVGIGNLAVVNDAYGFEIADEVIVAVGRRLRQVVRAGDAIARYSGSKFGIILNNCAEHDLTVATERFLAAARESVIETERGPVWAMLSIGGVVLPENAADANTAMARAEEALTEAKHLPSDGFCLYKPSAKRVSERGLNARCATEIVACLREDRFKLAFQPIVHAATGEPAMHEALLRMADASGEMIAAAHLIPIAEKLGLVRLIDRTVVQMAVGILLAYPQAQLAFNVSGITATDPRWFSQLTDILGTHREVMDRLTVEITETVALNDLEQTAEFTSALRALGCRVAIDDFGAGYTSFRNLKALAVDILKLDGSFCVGLGQNQENQYFVRSLIDLAKKFDLKTTAEWIEQEEDAAFLREWGIDFMQGNLFGKAIMDVPWQAADAPPLDFARRPAGFELFALPALPEAEPEPDIAAWTPEPEPEIAWEPEPEPAIAWAPEPEPPKAPPEPEPEVLATPPAEDDPIDSLFDLSRLKRAIEALNGSFARPGAAPDPNQ